MNPFLQLCEKAAHRLFFNKTKPRSLSAKIGSIVGSRLDAFCADVSPVGHDLAGTLKLSCGFHYELG